MKKTVISLFIMAFVATSGLVFANNGHGNHGNNGNHGGQGGGDFWNGGHGNNGGFGGGYGNHGGYDGHGCGNTAPEPVSTALFLLGGATLAVRRIRRKK